MKKELLREARGKLEHAIAALEDVEIELDGHERTLVNHIIGNQREYIEFIDRMIVRTQEKL